MQLSSQIFGRVKIFAYSLLSGEKRTLSSELVMGGAGSSLRLHTFATVMGLINAGRLKPILDSSFPLSDIRSAHERLDRGDVLGKITLSI